MYFEVNVYGDKSSDNATVTKIGGSTIKHKVVTLMGMVIKNQFKL